MGRGFGGASFDVLLAGYFGFGNLGDELLARSAVERLSDMGISPGRVAMLSGDPGASEASFGVRAFDRWGARSVSEALDMSRSLLLAGGGLFQDSTSVRSCVYYWGLARMAGWKSRPVWALGQSVGPLSSRLSRYLARDALSRCEYLAVRDAASSGALDVMGVPHEIMPDMVLALPVPEVSAPNSNVVLVNIRPCAGGAESGLSVAKAACACRAAGMELAYVAMSREDELEMKKFQGAGDLPGGDVTAVGSLDEFVSEARRARAAIGMRLHFGILSVLAGLAVALSPYDPKVACFARDWGVKLLNSDDARERFDVTRLLTNSHFQDKRKRESAAALVASHFDAGARCVLGE
ncbi:MAG: polysaccharide pyruvyl transferase family protein [Synergistaceae bacterium]|jgi:polysaccharide pyruvyl transferase CsaB|nr:polysaccharide pyruvyl transferase family protein [Synergistaceae bacterium]